MDPRHVALALMLFSLSCLAILAGITGLIPWWIP